MKKLLFFLFTALICPSLHAMEEGAARALKLKLEDTVQAKKSVPSLQQIALVNMKIDQLLKLFHSSKKEFSQELLLKALLEKAKEIGFYEFFQALKDLETKETISPTLIDFITRNIWEIPKITLSDEFDIDPSDIFIKLTKEELGNHIKGIYQDDFFSSPAIVSIFLKAGADPNTSLSKYGLYNTLLHRASEENRPEITQMILDAGARVDQPNARNKTPLDVAAQEDNAEVAQVLINNGADVNRKDHLDTTPLYLAVRNNSLKVAPILLQAGAQVDEKILDRAKSGGNLEMIKLLEEAAKKQATRN